MLENSHMAHRSDEPEIYRSLVSLKPATLSLGKWATDAGLARNYFNGLRQHGNPKDKAVDALLGVIGKTRADLVGPGPIVRSEVVGTGLTTGRDIRDSLYDERSLDLPLLGTAFGGEYDHLDENVDVIELRLSETLGYLPRPKAFADDPKAYVLTIVGESMRPRFRPGERVGVHTRLPVSIGDDVIVQLKDSDGDDGERICMVLVKELVRRSGSYVELRQYNPDITFRVEAKRIAAMHVVKANFF